MSGANSIQNSTTGQSALQLQQAQQAQASHAHRHPKPAQAEAVNQPTQTGNPNVGNSVNTTA